MKNRLHVQLLSGELPAIFIDAIVGVSESQQEEGGPVLGMIMITSGGSLLTSFTKQQILDAIDEAMVDGTAELKEETKNA